MSEAVNIYKSKYTDGAAVDAALDKASTAVQLEEIADTVSKANSALQPSDVGTTANKIVQLNNDARLPALDGGLLTNLPFPDVGAAEPSTDANNAIIQGSDQKLYLNENTLIRPLENTETWTIGPSGDYATVEEALLAGQRMVRTNLALLILELADGTHVVENNAMVPIGGATRIIAANAGAATLQLDGWLGVSSGALILSDIVITGSGTTGFDVSGGTLLAFGITVNSNHGRVFYMADGVASITGDITAPRVVNAYRDATFMHNNGTVVVSNSFGYDAGPGSTVSLTNVSVSGATAYAVGAYNGGVASVSASSTIADTPLAGSALNGGRIHFAANTTFTNVDTIGDPVVGTINSDGSMVTDGSTPVGGSAGNSDLILPARNSAGFDGFVFEARA